MSIRTSVCDGMSLKLVENLAVLDRATISGVEMQE